MAFEWEGIITFFGATDLDKIHTFYSDTLGFKLYMDQGVCRLYEVPGGGMIGFCTHVPPTPGEKSPLITFLTEDVDAVYSLMVEKGYKPLEKPKKNPRFPVYHFFVQDPEGYKVEIQRFTE